MFKTGFTSLLVAVQTPTHSQTTAKTPQESSADGANKYKLSAQILQSQRNLKTFRVGDFSSITRTWVIKNGGPGLKAFPFGFKMISGNAAKRAKTWPVGLGTQAELSERAIQWVCQRSGTNITTYDNSATCPAGDD